MDNLDINNIEIRNIVLIDKDSSADLYMQELFPLWVDVVVVSLEGKYPLNADLRSTVLELLKTNPNLNIFIYGANAEKFVTASQKRLSMYSILGLDLRRYPWQKPVFDFDEFKIVELCKAFAMSQDLSRLQNYNMYINVMMPDSIKWYHELLRS